MQKNSSQVDYISFFFPFPAEVVNGTIITRYKRFLCDIRLENDTVITAHVPNSGSMKTCWQPGCRVAITRHSDPGKRKLLYTLQAVEMPDGWVSVNTMNPNNAVARAIIQGCFPGFHGYERLQTEVKTDAGSRFDLVLFNRQHLLQNQNVISLKPERAVNISHIPDYSLTPLLIEIKNATLREKDGVIFPDSITLRGQKHLKHLQHYVKAGFRCMILFFAGRSNSNWVGPAANIDPEYAKLLREAIKNGVEAIAVKVEVCESGLNICGTLPVRI